ncbi:MAG: sigma-70 family RNA polymerase sigma factor [Deltaproteobacteria bacterium]|nr:sigma-70 family RNA polymerase sigma factor [Deltaproteobacteria bacterium]
MSHGVTDAELIAASRRGERAAFGHLVERYQDLVCAVSYSSTRNRALSEDVAQDTFLAAWAQLDQLREATRVRAWLCGIARNLARKARVHRRREEPQAEVDQSAADLRATPYEAVSQAQTSRQVWDALARIPAAYREVMVLYYQQQRSIAEIAEALMIREDAALQRLTRGRRLLAREVAVLIESALADDRPRKNLVAGVLAALPPIGSTSMTPWLATRPTHVAGATRMFKIAFAVLATVSAAGAGYVATRSSEAAPGPAPSPAPAIAALASPAPVASRDTGPAPSMIAASPASPHPAAHPPVLAAADCDPCAQGAAPTAVDDTPVAPALIAKTRLYDGPARGPADAPVQIAVFMDLECSFCAAVLGTIDQLWDEYPGQLRLVVKQLPLDQHSGAQLASEASLAAAAQDKFWAFHDLALAEQDDLTRASLIAIAGRAGLDVPRFTRALDQHTFADAVARDVAAAHDLDVQGTPAFFINGVRFVGNQPITRFRAAIDHALGR